MEKTVVRVWARKGKENQYRCMLDEQTVKEKPLTAEKGVLGRKGGERE